MSLRNIITHPLAVMISFMIVLISGEHVGGFYIIYLLMGITHGTIPSLFGIAGIVLLVPALLIAQRKQAISIYLLNIVGILFMILSLFLFFFNDEQRYNINTFYQFIPFCTITLFCLLALIFLAGNIRILLRAGLIKK
ncbi:hypothetical protein FRZ67_19050 [Panacibacter ginsenosidivorans]|uniref:DUF4293 family protein n=1 Tax=Panacibacter ginsenosidivorans TaxID=1813871 RepID=A0A5B8VE74_9BACT|nr:hypothetical protein [Panacibacter ginsenosidivorans]QEC69301.1 hypothetical protein FRZ67_19050 [Panacibacter ginsenosidivorans]